VGATAGLVAASLRPVQYEGVTTILIGRSNSVIASATSRALLENHTLAGQTLTEIGSDVSPQAFVSNALVVEQVPGTNVMKVKVTLRDAAKAAQASRVLSQKAVELNRRIASEEGSAVRGQLKVLLDQSAERLKAAEEHHLHYQDQAQVELLKKDTEKMIAERGDLLRLRIDIETEKAKLAAAEQEIQKHERVLSAPRAVAAETALQRAGGQAAAREATDAVLREVADQTAALRSAADKPLPLEPKKDTNTETNREIDKGRNRELEKRFAAQSAAVDATQDALSRIAALGTEADPQLLALSHPFMNPVYQTLSFQIATSRTRLAALERQQREMLVVGKLGNGRFEELSDLYRRTSELARLENNLDLEKRIYGDLTLRYEQSRAESVGSMVQLQIVDEAVTPEWPLPRKRAQATALGATGGLVFFALVVLAWRTRGDRGWA
jgi:uncharacterized protein involved in exopolysaccharide biosynthesis